MKLAARIKKVMGVARLRMTQSRTYESPNMMKFSTRVKGIIVHSNTARSRSVYLGSLNMVYRAIYQEMTRVFGGREADWGKYVMNCKIGRLNWKGGGNPDEAGWLEESRTIHPPKSSSHPKPLVPATLPLQFCPFTI